jgi:hypothetical protein
VDENVDSVSVEVAYTGVRACARPTAASPEKGPTQKLAIREIGGTPTYARVS